MKLHWSPRSPFVRKVMIVAHELGLTERIARVRTVAATTRPHPELMQDNPLSKIPTLVLDDGTVLYNSRVICEYLDGLHGGRTFFPADTKTRMVALRRQALGDGCLDFLLLLRNERERAQSFGRASFGLHGQEAERTQVAGARGRRSRRHTVQHRACGDRHRPLLSRFPLCRRGLAHPAPAHRAVASGFQRASFRARDGAGR